MRKVVLSLLLVVLAAFAVIPAIAQSGQTIGDWIDARSAGRNAQFANLSAALEAAGLTATLNGAGPFTIFAPTDAAFGGLPANVSVEDLLADTAYLTDILNYHVVAGALTAADVAASSSLTTAQGSPLYVRADEDGTIFINNTAQVVNTVVAGNGIVHVIDDILVPGYEVDSADLFFVNGDANLLTQPAGEPTGATVTRCQTFFADRYEGGFYRLVGVGSGWLDARLTLDVAEDYGQPGGQPRFEGC